MRIEQSKYGTGCWTVHVDSNELVTESGKALPYPTTIGIINSNGTVKVWTPAAYKPRGYALAARDMLEQAREELITSGELHAKPRAADYRSDLRTKASRRADHERYVRAYGRGR